MTEKRLTIKELKQKIRCREVEYCLDDNAKVGVRVNEGREYLVLNYGDLEEIIIINE